MRKSLITVGLSLALLTIGMYFGIGWYFSNLILTPRQKAPNLQHEAISSSGEAGPDLLPQPEMFSLQGAEQVELKGWYFQRSDTATCAVVLVHGWGSVRSDMLKYADLFWDCGCDIVAYDHRGHGESGKAYGTGGIKEKEDLIGVTDWLVEKTGLSRENIGWVGASWGAATALEAAAHDKDIAFILADSPFQDWESAIFERALRQYGSWVAYLKPGVMAVVDMRAEVDYEEASPLLAAKELSQPVFLIHSQTDQATSSSQSVHIAESLDPDTHVFYHTDWGAGHTKDINERPEEFRHLVYDFLEKYVGKFGDCGQVRAQESLSGISQNGEE